MAAFKCVLGIMTLLVVTAVQAQSVTRSTFRALEEAQELMETEMHQEALAKLEALATKTTGNPYDHALTNQYLAHTYVLLDDEARARQALETALAMPDLPDDLRTSMNLFYGTVLLGDEEYELARNALQEWYELTEFPTPTQVFSYGYATYMAGDVQGAEPLIVRAIGLSTESPESWHQLYYRVLFEQQKYPLAETILKERIAHVPGNNTYWRMLASHYLQLEESNDGLAALMIAYSNELLESEADLRQIVSLWGYIEAPDKGARLLESWLATEKLTSDAETLKQLGNLWLMSRERSNAIGVLTKAAELSPDGRTFELLGGIYFDEEEWGAAYSAYSDAIRMGDLEDSPRVSLLAGISAFRAGQHEDAKKALSVAAEIDELRPQAESILKQMD